MGTFDEAFLSIPPEVIRTTIRNNQKNASCCAIRAARSWSASSILVANIEARDGGKANSCGQRACDPGAALGCKIFFMRLILRQAGGSTAEVSADRSFMRSSGRRLTALPVWRRWRGILRGGNRCRRTEVRTRGAPLQGRPAHRSRRRVSRAARAHGQVLRASARRR